MAKVKNKKGRLSRWFISRTRRLDEPGFGYWEFWDGSQWVGKFVDARLFADADEAAR
jgi:hypothetical protein